MSRLRQLISEVHRRSLWQVLLVYAGASWAVFTVVQTLTEGLGLPEWFPAFALVLLLVGLPIVLATAFVREDTASPQPRDPTLLGEQPLVSPARVATYLTWPRAILGGVLAFAGLALISAFIVIRGAGRVTEAYGEAGDAFGERDWIGTRGAHREARRRGGHRGRPDDRNDGGWRDSCSDAGRTAVRPVRRRIR